MISIMDDELNAFFYYFLDAITSQFRICIKKRSILMFFYVLLVEGKLFARTKGQRNSEQTILALRPTSFLRTRMRRENA